MKRALAGLGILAGVLLLVSGIRAKRLVAESFHADVQVQTDGSLHVTETARFRFHGGPFSTLTRAVPRRNVDRLEWLGSSDPYTVDDRKFNARVRWTFTPARDTVRTVTLEYVAHGAFEVHGGVRELYWHMAPRNRKYRIEIATAEVHWPPQWNLQSLRVRGAKTAQSAGTATFERRKLNHDEHFAFRARFSTPETAPAPAWQGIRDGRREHLLVVGLCAGAVMLLGLGLVTAQAREAGAGAARIVPQTGVHEPPAEIPPALAGAAWRGRSQWPDIVATLVDLAQRGYVTIEAQQGKRGWSSGAWNLHRTPMTTGVQAWEKIVLETVFQDAEERVVPAARATMALVRKKSQFEAAVRAQLRQQGLYDAHAEEARARLRGTAGVWAAATVALSAAVPLVWRVAGEGALLLPVATLVVALVALVLSGSIPRHSPHGRRTAAAWAGYREFLRKVQEAAKPPVDPEWFQRQLTYAIALDTGKPWLVAAKKWPPPVPAWFRLPAEGGGNISDVLAWLASLIGSDSQPGGLKAEPALAAALRRRHVA